METEPLRIFQKIHLDTIFLSALSDETKFFKRMLSNLFITLCIIKEFVLKALTYDKEIIFLQTLLYR